jgi:hypothetical protein
MRSTYLKFRQITHYILDNATKYVYLYLYLIIKNVKGFRGWFVRHVCTSVAFRPGFSMLSFFTRYGPESIYN